MAKQSDLFKKGRSKTALLLRQYAAMAEWSNAPVWKAGLLTEARVQISFAAYELFRKKLEQKMEKSLIHK